MTDTPSDDLDTALPRPGWRRQPHGWRPEAEELGYRACGRNYAVRRAVCVDCWYAVIDGDMVAGKHSTPQAAMEATEGVAAQLARKARPAPWRGRRGAPGTPTTPPPVKPLGSIPMSTTGKLIATVPWSTSKDIDINSAGPAALRTALAAIAQASGAAFIIGALATGTAGELAAAPGEHAADIALLQRQGAEAKARYVALGYPLLITAQRALAAGLDWQAIVRQGAAKGVDGIPEGLIRPKFGPPGADFVMAALEAIIRHEAQATSETPDEFVARVLGWA